MSAAITMMISSLAGKNRSFWWSAASWPAAWPTRDPTEVPDPADPAEAADAKDPADVRGWVDGAGLALGADSAPN